jgi:hypothetical protein
VGLEAALDALPPGAEGRRFLSTPMQLDMAGVEDAQVRLEGTLLTLCGRAPRPGTLADGRGPRWQAEPMHATGGAVAAAPEPRRDGAERQARGPGGAQRGVLPGIEGCGGDLPAAAAAGLAARCARNRLTDQPPDRIQPGAQRVPLLTHGRVGGEQLGRAHVLGLNRAGRPAREQPMAGVEAARGEEDALDQPAHGASAARQHGGEEAAAMRAGMLILTALLLTPQTTRAQEPPTRTT